MKHTPVEHLKRTILELLRSNPNVPFRRNEIAKYLRIPATSDEYEYVRQALEDLEQANEIKKTERRRYVFATMPVAVAGTLTVLKNGSGFVEIEEGDIEEVAIRESDMLTAFHGDRVKVRLLPTQTGKPQGEIVEVVERKTTTLVGTLVKRGSFFIVEPDNQRYTHDIYVARHSLQNAKPSDKVVVKLFPWNDPGVNPEGEIVEVIGKAGEPRVEITSIARRYDLSHDFPKDVVRESEHIPSVIPKQEIAARLDLRNDVCFTIDPEDAKDFDDAVSLKKLENGEFELGVHIADVSHFVVEGSALDAEAFRRGTSTYLVNGVIPMLPERLSNDICSLRPDEDRLTYSIIMQVTPRGVVHSYQIRKSIIRSKRRFTYAEALERIETGKGDFAEELRMMQHFAEILLRKRLREGSINFETPEVKFIFNEEGIPVEVQPKSSNKATKLIEDFMLLANQTAARHVNELARSTQAGTLPFLYRIHDVPNPDKLRDLAKFVKQFGYSLQTENIKPQAIQKLLESVQGTAEETLINGIALRSMAKAVYSEFNVGHFGLSFPYYTHFTSPIRRYPDLIVHRILFEYERGMSNPRKKFYNDGLGDIADWCSRRERTAVEAERDSVKVAQAEYISNHIGDEFEGLISGVQPYGIFVELKGNYVEGLIRVRDMDDDYYNYEEEKFSLIGRRTRKSYRLGDSIRVRVVRVNKERHEVDLQVVQPTGAGSLAKPGKNKPVRRGRSPRKK
jgi:ribonuclease R